MATAKRVRSNSSSSKKTTNLEQMPSPISLEAGNGLPPAEFHDQVRTRAYELYSERGFQDGFAQDDWLRAESEILNKNQRRSA
jgi:hypothetical protein